MNPPEPTQSAPQSPAQLNLPQAWDELLLHMQELHARLEYLRLMLRLDRQTH